MSGTCSSCYEDCDEHDDLVCPECSYEAWESAIEIGRQEGAAVVFGLLGMAEAIAAKHWLQACPACGKAEGSRVYAAHGSYDIDVHWARPWMCMPCSNATLKRGTE